MKDPHTTEAKRARTDAAIALLRWFEDNPTSHDSWEVDKAEAEAEVGAAIFAELGWRFCDGPCCPACDQ